MNKAMMVSGGKISGMRVVNGIVEAVEYSPDASVIWYNDENIMPSIKIIQTDSIPMEFTGIEKIDELIKQGYIIKGIFLDGNKLIDVAYGKQPSPFPDDIKTESFVEVGSKEQNTVGKPIAFLSSANRVNGTCSVLPGEKIVLRGINYDKAGPLPKVFLNGDPLTAIKLEKWDGNGSYYMEFDAPRRMGYHSITLNQYLPNKKLITQTDEFMVSHQDEPQKERAPDPENFKMEPDKKEPAPKASMDQKQQQNDQKPPKKNDPLKKQK